MSSEESGRVRVGVRVRPGDGHLLVDGGPRRIKAALDAGVAVTYSFDRVFWPASQRQVYDELAAPLVLKASRGYNACLFAYGQTGSGKTYSMHGDDEHPGVIPRFCRHLFEQLRPDAVVDMSFYEIYNEKIHDLLADDEKTALRVREHPVAGPYVEGLSMRRVARYPDVEPLLVRGNQRRSSAATVRNERSSRSHAIVELVVQYREEGASIRSKVSLVDLAGSERVARAHSTGDRYKEGLSINKSLLTLGKVITCLSDSKKNDFVPYRDSVLTWLLKENLGKNSCTAMLATVSPETDCMDETLATLRYACRARRIVNRISVNEDPQSKMIRELKREIEKLKVQKCNNGIKVDIEIGNRSSMSGTFITDDKLQTEIQKLTLELRNAENRRNELESQRNLFIKKVKMDDVSYYESDFFEELKSILDDSAELSDSDDKSRKNYKNKTLTYLNDMDKLIDALRESCPMHIKKEVFNDRISPLISSMKKLHGQVHKEILLNDRFKP